MFHYKGNILLTKLYFVVSFLNKIYIHVNISELIKQDLLPLEQQLLVQLYAASDDNINPNINPNNISGTFTNTTSTLQQSMMTVDFIIMSEFAVVFLLITTNITLCLVHVCYSFNYIC